MHIILASVFCHFHTHSCTYTWQLWPQGTFTIIYPSVDESANTQWEGSAYPQITSFSYSLLHWGKLPPPIPSLWPSSAANRFAQTRWFPFQWEILPYLSYGGGGFYIGTFKLSGNVLHSFSVWLAFTSPHMSFQNYKQCYPVKILFILYIFLIKQLLHYSF